jgi:hypothetical protein
MVRIGKGLDRMLLFSGGHLIDIVKKMSLPGGTLIEE